MVTTVTALHYAPGQKHHMSVIMIGVPALSTDAESILKRHLDSPAMYYHIMDNCPETDEDELLLFFSRRGYVLLVNDEKLDRLRN